MLGLSQMGGFLTLLLGSALFFVLSSVFGHDDGGGEVGGHDEVSSGDNGPSLLSVRNLFLFGIGFGAAGTVATHMGYSLAISSLWGLAFGALTAFLGFLFYRTISRQQATTNTSTRNLVGKLATVSTQIPKGRMGQIVTHDEYGSMLYLNARSSGEDDIQRGVRVVITETFGDTVTVSLT